MVNLNIKIFIILVSGGSTWWLSKVYNKEKKRENASFNVIKRMEIRIRRRKIQILEDAVQKLYTFTDEEKSTLWTLSDQEVSSIFPELIMEDFCSTPHRRRPGAEDQPYGQSSL